MRIAKRHETQSVVESARRIREHRTIVGFVRRQRAREYRRRA